MVTKNQTTSSEVMREIITRSMLALVEVINNHHKGNANLIMRDIKMLHSNTTFADLPEYLQDEIRKLNGSMFGYLNKEGYLLVPKN